MALTGIIGALVALVPALAARQIAANRCKSEDERRTNMDRMQALVADLGDKTHPRFVAGYDAGLKDGRRAVDGLVRSRAQLVDHIELLERELSLERQMSAHWLAEAQRLIRDNRDWRAYQPQQDPRQALAQADAQAQALTRYAQMQQAQQTMALALAQAQQNAQQDGSFCNCVPSRAQVWGASQGLVQQLNRGDG
jgi:hypothetical protein